MSAWSPAALRLPVTDNNGTLAVRLYLATAQARAIEANEAERRAARARRPLLWVTVTHTLAAALTVAVLFNPIRDGDPRSQLVAAAAVGVAAAFWAVWGWAAIAPLPAAIVGLVMYATMTAAGWAALPDAPAAVNSAEAAGQSVGFLVGLAWVLTTAGLLLRAIQSAVAARRAIDLTVPATGVLPSLLLYAALLTVLCVARAVTLSAGSSVQTLFTAMRVMAFVVVAASLVGWRTVWPAVAKAEVSWLAVGVLAGLGTFAWASLYSDLTVFAFGLPRLAQAEPLVTAGYGWAGAVLAVAVYPAVVEELAFRGLIVPRLGRVMTGGQTVAVSGAMFAVLHLNVTAVPVLLPIGVLLAVLRRRSGSLWPCILMHLTHNGAVLAAERWL